MAILREANACPEGKVGEVLRRYGIYSSHLSKWRQMRAAGDLVAKKRGPKVDERAQRLAQVEREKAQLAARLHKAELITLAPRFRAAQVRVSHTHPVRSRGPYQLRFPYEMHSLSGLTFRGRS